MYWLLSPLRRILSSGEVISWTNESTNSLFGPRQLPIFKIITDLFNISGVEYIQYCAN